MIEHFQLFDNRRAVEEELVTEPAKGELTMSTDQNEWAPSTDLVRYRYLSATISADTPERWMDRNRERSDAEFDRWLGNLKDQLRREIRAEEKPSNRLEDGAAKSESVADIYASSPLVPILIEALDHRPGDLTSGDFQRGYFAALTVTHIRGAAALENFAASDERELIAAVAGDRGISSAQADALADELIALGFSHSPKLTEWEYGWRSFFANGEEYEWLATHSREDAEQQIRDFQEEEDARFSAKDNSEGKLTYSLWRRRKSEAGPWERVEETTDGQD